MAAPVPNAPILLEERNWWCGGEVYGARQDLAQP